MVDFFASKHFSQVTQCIPKILQVLQDESMCWMILNVHVYYCDTYRKCIYKLLF